MTRPKNVRDPVWGEIVLEDDEWELINLPVFQRLRRIHQLGMTMLVFPGATHTRFEHSLGACHVAGRIADRLIRATQDGEALVPFESEDRRVVRLAGLLHDLGHGPFSHVSDPFLNRPGQSGHEWIGSMIVETDPDIRRIIGDETVRQVASILRGEGLRNVQRDIVSGPADADKIDYLLRDSHYAGVRQGIFDHDYFIDQVVAIPAASSDESWLGFHWRGQWAVEDMKLARYHMHRTVYNHRNRLVTDFMLRRGLRAAMADGVLPKNLLSLPEPGEFTGWFDVYRQYDDWAVMTICAGRAGAVGEMFDRLRDHRLLKLLVFEEGEDLKRAMGAAAARELHTRHERDDCAAIEATVAVELGLDPALVIVRVDNPNHALDHSTGTALADDDINLLKPTGETEPLYDQSEIFSATPSRRWLRRLLVYGPVGMKEDPTLAGRAREAALRALCDYVAGGAPSGA